MVGILKRRLQTYDADLAAIAALTTTSFGRGLLTMADAEAAREELEIETGTFTPTATLTANLDSATPQLARYIRVGDIVTASGIVTVDPTTNGALCQLDLTLPVASAFASIIPLSGAAAIIGSASVYVAGQPTDDRARFYWAATGTVAINLSYIYQYQVLT